MKIPRYAPRAPINRPMQHISISMHPAKPPLPRQVGQQGRWVTPFTHSSNVNGDLKGGLQRAAIIYTPPHLEQVAAGKVGGVAGGEVRK
ncbi:hypothetical protein HK097_009287 [Rhizophlyctis rosea]|uniref:Uncharacterized protein n=1 Tax=Rhizophlyctis rosea TaxID=64517 RepID=A0AAD5SJC8_9FUNG|nr:hypothetical protein HK097_009287 [Rhizophlyctis rosea]